MKRRGPVQAATNEMSAALQTLEMTTPMPASALPDLSETHGFYSVQNPDWPPLPADVLGLNVWPLGDGLFALDDRDVDYAALSGGYTPMFFSSATYTTNDLWLQIISYTNTTAILVIHPPWNDTNLTHDLFYTTSLTAPVNWRFLMRCPFTNGVNPGLPFTNVVATGLCGDVGFFRLGQTNGSLTVSTNATAQQLAQLLVPSWITPVNAKFTGTNVARGTFAGGNGCGLPIATGVILSSGLIDNAIGPNNDDGSIARYNGSELGKLGDSDLSKLVGNGATLDATVLEFDIISTNSFTLQFQYVFASEEYPEFIGAFNDPMAIFVSTNFDGTNWINSITNDLALVPGTTNVPVSVNTINGGCIGDYYGTNNPPINSQFYLDNHDPNNIFYWTSATNAAPIQEFNIQYDGMTVLLTAQTYITAGVTNHVKIGIADYAGTIGDDIYDSAVFITGAPIPCN
jgi:hypothetical protein